MVGAQPPNAGGMRRRHSSHNENSIHGIDDAAAEDSSVQAGTQDNAMNERRGSAEHSPRVRFSVDVERRAKTKRRKSDEDTGSNGSNSINARSKGLGLSVDTGAAQAEYGANIMGEATVASPANITSPRSAPVEQSFSIVSPKSRSRGMSLRSSLFLRNISQRTPSGHSAIELQDVPLSATDDTSQVRPGTANKSRGPSITIAPAYDRASSPPLKGVLGKGVLGASALPNYQQWVQDRARRHLPLRRISAAYSKVRKFVLQIQEIPPSKDGRHISLDASRKKALIDERINKPFISNLIRSSKYNAWNFLPRQLFAQFSKLANFYFLCISILQMIPGLSTTGTYTTIIPLLFFVSISMAKEGFEDLRRHRLDRSENNRQANVLHAYRPVLTSDGEAERAPALEGPIHWAPVKWHSLQVGDIIKLERDEAVPADIVLLGSKGANNIAYVETMALDGETNLKNKQPTRATVEASSSSESLAAARMEFVVEDPNLDLYNFEGKVTVDGEVSPLTNNEIIYRGSIIRNTPEAIGMIIYTGEECKIRMNANKNPRIKSPTLQASVNRIVFLIVCFVVALSLFDAIAYQIWSASTESKAWYLTNAGVSFGPIIVSFIIMFNTMIPLSLYVSLEIVKLFQMFLLNDIDMYDEESNTPFEARTSTINEELGQVSYVFSDKTGTLTENVMRFRKLSIAGTAWLHDADLQNQQPEQEMLMHKKRRQRSKGKRPVRMLRKSTSSQAIAKYRPSRSNPSIHESSAADPIPRISRASTSASQWRSSAMPSIPQNELSTGEMIRYIQRHPQSAFASRAKMMILSLALCHTCLPERIEDENGDEEVTFQASSPDELALVQAAKEMGFLAYSREASTLTLKLQPYGPNGEPHLETYEVLDVIEFSSKRKRMSVIVRFPDNRIAVICKGADSVVMDRLRLSSLANQKLYEIEKRALQRKSMEAEQALRRKSSQMERQGSMASFSRTSTSLARKSTTIRRPSMGVLAPIRDEVDGWLNEREHDVDTSPRVSSHFRPSMAPSERHSSIHSMYEDDINIDEGMVQNDGLVVERCFQHITDFATEGLRTLLYGYRFLDDDEYQTWKKVYHDATTSLVDRQILIEKAGELIEQQLELGGATAIEDKLQKGVPESIERLRRANIKMWMLTGDKRETAINIGHSCRLIKDYSAVTVLDHEAGDVEQNIAASIIDINRGDIAHSVVVIDGSTLGMIESDEGLHTLFLDLAILADSVICCRASPSQKAGLVSAIRRKVKRSVTLAIGDGANDIAMIQEAHVGIGITGKEGLQAARTSDYSIAQFRFLTKLLLVHGRWNYIRTCKYTLGTFWKEFLFYLTQAFYQRWNGYTGTSLYESWSLSMFNTLFTSLVVIFLGIFEQDLRASTLIAVPELYTKGQRSAGFNLKVYLSWMFMATSEAVIIYFGMWGFYGSAPFIPEPGLYPMGDLTFTAAIIVIATKLQVIEQRNKSIMALIGFLLSVGGWFLWNVILAGAYTNNNEYAVKEGFFDGFGRSGLWWMTLILITSACILFELAVRAVKAAFFPTDVEAFQALEQDREVRKRFEEASAAWMQAGWNHGTKKSSIELARDEAEQAKREGEVQELLDRPRVMEEGRSYGGSRLDRIETEEQAVMVEDGPGRGSTEIQEMLSRRFGSVRQGTLSQA